MSSTLHSCHILMTIELSSQIFENYSNIKYSDNTPVETELFHAGGRTDRNRQTDRYGKGNSRLTQFGKAPKTPCCNIQNLWDITPFFPLVSMCLKANAQMVPKTPGCYCMLLVFNVRTIEQQQLRRFFSLNVLKILMQTKKLQHNNHLIYLRSLMVLVPVCCIISYLCVRTVHMFDVMYEHFNSIKVPASHNFTIGLLVLRARQLSRYSD